MRKVLLNLFFFLFFFSGTIYVMSGINMYQFPMLAGSIFVGFLLYRKYWMVFKAPINSTNLYYVMFCLSLVLSGIINESIGIVFESFGMFMLWVLFSVYFPKDRYYLTDGIKHSVYIIVIPFVLTALYSFGLFGIRLFRYTGVFRNANGFGDAAVTASAAILVKGIIDLDKNNNEKKREIIIDIILMILCGFCTLISTCRGAIVCELIMILFFIIIVYHNRGASLKQICRLVFFIIFLLLVLYIISLTTLGRDLINNIKAKITYKSDNVLDGRTEKWDIIFNRISLFGNGEETAVAAHNTFFGIMDQYGLLAMSWLLLFTFSGIYKSFRLAWNRSINGLGKYFGFFSFIGFFLLSLTEGMMLKTIMLMTIFSTPLVDKRNYLGDFLL